MKNVHSLALLCRLGHPRPNRPSGTLFLLYTETDRHRKRQRQKINNQECKQEWEGGKRKTDWLEYDLASPSVRPKASHRPTTESSGPSYDAHSQLKITELLYRKFHVFYSWIQKPLHNTVWTQSHPSWLKSYYTHNLPYTIMLILLTGIFCPVKVDTFSQPLHL